MASQGFYKYLELASKKTTYAKRMQRLSARIFGEVVRPTRNRSMRVVRMFSENPIEQRPEIVKYYPPHPTINQLVHDLRRLGLYRDEHLDFQEEMERLRTLRGKGSKKRPPKNTELENKESGSAQ